MNRLSDRAVRALTEYLTVVPEAADLYKVYSGSGQTYTVDAREEVCDCTDHAMREVACKHILRVQFEIGDRAIPAWVDREAIPRDFASHVDGEPRFSNDPTITDTTETPA